MTALEAIFQPGRELDALVAEKVMGWTHVKNGQGVLPGADLTRTYFARVIPNYSTDIAAAWEVVEKFKAAGKYKLEISSYPGGDAHWTIKAFAIEPGKSCTTSAMSLPHAICLAALKAVGAL